MELPGLKNKNFLFLFISKMGKNTLPLGKVGSVKFLNLYKEYIFQMDPLSYLFKYRINYITYLHNYIILCNSRSGDHHYRDLLYYSHI